MPPIDMLLSVLLTDFPPWEWYAPYISMFIGGVASWIIARRSQSFKELNEVKNTYRMRVAELEKHVVKLDGKVNKMQAAQNDNIEHIGRLQTITDELIRREDECQRKLLEYIQKYQKQ